MALRRAPRGPDPVRILGLSAVHSPGESSGAEIVGSVDARFASVREAFAENFASRGETGASVCISVNGRVVADLAGGLADPATAAPFGPDTLANAFSVGKGFCALLVARLAGDGVLALDEPVAEYWPEFAASGKGGITVRHVLTHQAGLPAIRRRLPPGAMLDREAMCAALAAEAPWWEPGTAHGYHVNTFGLLVGEIVRRVTGASLGALLASEVAGPLGADVHIGLPAREHGRVATFSWPVAPAAEQEPAGLSEADLMAFNAYHNPSGLSGNGLVNTPEWRQAELPSTNCHATARGVERVYAALSAGGRTAGVRIVSAEALAEATIEQVSGEDLVLRRPSRFGVGFQLTQTERRLGPNPGAFGHFGAGGSLGFSDPESGVAFGYVINSMGPRWQNPRNAALIEAVFDALG